VSSKTIWSCYPDFLCYNKFINHQKETVDNLIEIFFNKGGHINKFYLKKKKRNPTLVYLNGWFRGRNIREAILKALADK
jgi:hypothetical protein